MKVRDLLTNINFYYGVRDFQFGALQPRCIIILRGELSLLAHCCCSFGVLFQLLIPLH